LAVFKKQARSGRSRLAISALVIGVVIFVAVGIAAELILLPKASTPSGASTTATGTAATSGPSTIVTPSSTVQTAIANWVADFNSRNVNGISAYYANDANVVWAGDASGLAGTYNGVDNIRILYGSSIGKTLILNVSASNIQANMINPDYANVTMTLTMAGTSSVVGTLTADISAYQTWYYENGAWQIQKETWTYNTFTEQYPVSATTFPQWAALKTGQNPNLVSEKSFEWHAGPYVAASVYAVMFGVLAIGVIKFRSRPKAGQAS
jgi:ketosteroid isomerase-like protein